MHWKTTIMNNSIVFSTLSKEQTSGYPGNLNVAAKISLSPISGELKIEYSGMTTDMTPIDISSSLLLNLAGHETGTYSNLAYYTFLIFLTRKKSNFATNVH